MANEYVSRDELKQTLEITSNVTYANEDIDAAVASASRALDDMCNRRFWKDADAAQVRYYSPNTEWRLWPDDVIAVTSLKSDPGGDGTFEDTWTLNTDYTREPLNAATDSRPWTLLRAHPSGNFRFPTAYPRSVELTGQFGWPAVPPAIKQATTLLASRILKRAREVPFGVIAVGIDVGSTISIARADPDVELLIAPFKRTLNAF